jgi:HEAT repeat protein
MARLTYYCWHCYGESVLSRGPCERCGRPIEAPEATTYLERLLWALDHPLGEIRLFAVQALGARRDRSAAGRLRELATETRDPYVAAEAVRSLVLIEGEENVRDVLERVIETGTAPARRAAREALSGSPGVDGR